MRKYLIILPMLSVSLIIAQEEEDRLAQEEETGHPRKDEIDMFKRIVSENTGPACNIYGIAPCPEWPNFIKTKPSIDDIPIYKETKCEGEFNDKEYLLKAPKTDYIDCLIYFITRRICF